MSDMELNWTVVTLNVCAVVIVVTKSIFRNTMYLLNIIKFYPRHTPFYESLNITQNGK